MCIRDSSDGGAWRKKTSDTSWYNEELGTLNRGYRREFPAVAILAASSTALTIYDADATLPEFQKFKSIWGQGPTAYGNCPWPERRPRDNHKEFKWDAVRFANKVYAVFHEAKKDDTDILVWMDADTYVHSPITYGEFRLLVPPQAWLHYLGRNKKWPECGFYGLTLRSPGADAFLKVLGVVKAPLASFSMCATQEFAPEGNGQLIPVSSPETFVHITEFPTCRAASLAPLCASL